MNDDMSSIKRADKRMRYVESGEFDKAGKFS